jgi:protein ImuB
MLWASILLPSLPLDVFARTLAPTDDRPFVVGSGGHYPRVVAVNAAARAAGIRREQLVSAAFALAPELLLCDRDEAAEHAALAEVATLALAFTPQASIALPNAVVADIEASIRLFGGLRRLLETLVRAVRARGYAPRIALAPTPTTALLIARAGDVPDVLDIADVAATLAPLPLSLLDLEPATLETLKAAGITTFGAASALPRASLARRFGRTLVDALDRASGRIPDPRVPYRPPPRFERKLPLPAPVDSVEALGFAVNRLVNEFTGWLLARGLGAVRMSLAMIHERYVRERGTAPTVATFALGAPSRTPEHLRTVLNERLARIALPAPVEAIVLASEETAPLAGRNLGLLPEDEAARVIVPLVERLRSRLGDDAVVVLEPLAEHRPELATTETMPGSPRPASATRADTPAPRPIWLMDEVQPLDTLLETKPCVLRDGPERIESGWWDGRDFRRDYFVAETQNGEVVWIYRDHRYGSDDGEWFLHGYFA